MFHVLFLDVEAKLQFVTGLKPRIARSKEKRVPGWGWKMLESPTCTLMAMAQTFNAQKWIKMR